MCCQPCYGKDIFLIGRFWNVLGWYSSTFWTLKIKSLRLFPSLDFNPCTGHTDTSVAKHLFCRKRTIDFFFRIAFGDSCKPVSGVYLSLNILLRPKPWLTFTNNELRGVFFFFFFWGGPLSISWLSSHTAVRCHCKVTSVQYIAQILFKGTSIIKMLKDFCLYWPTGMFYSEPSYFRT